MSTLPIRARAPVFSPSSAPSRSVALPGFNAGAWRPAALRSGAGGVRVLKLVPRLGRINPGWLLAAALSDLALRETTYALTMFLNGLALKQICVPLPTDSFSGNSICSTGQARGEVMGKLPQFVQGLSPGANISFIGFTHYVGGVISPFNWRGRVTQIYQVVASGAIPRPRPWYGPMPVAPGQVLVWSPTTTHLPPGRVPFDVRPLPVWAGVRGPTAPSPTPDLPADTLRPAPGLGTGIRWTFDGTNNPPRVEPITRPIDARVLPRPNETEVKIGANTAAAQAFFAVMRAREQLSEFNDFVGVLFDSLPKHTQARYGGRNASDHQKMVAIAENIGKMDAQKFLHNLIANQIEDEIIGRTWFAGRAKLRNAVFGNRVGSLGEVANPLFKQYAKAVSDLSKGLADAIMGKTGYKADRSLENLMYKAEIAYRRLIGSANQSPTPSRAIPRRKFPE